MSFEVTSETRIVAGKRVVRLRVVETAVGSSSEWDTGKLDGVLPASGTVVHLQSSRISGTGTTVQPKLGKISAWAEASINHIGKAGAAAANVNEGIPLPYTYPVGAKVILYGRSQVNNAATDHAIETLITIVEIG